MKHKITAAILTLLAAVSVWQAFAQTQTPCQAACKAKFDACMKQLKASDDADTKAAWQLNCELAYHDCVKECK